MQRREHGWCVVLRFSAFDVLAGIAAAVTWLAGLPALADGLAPQPRIVHAIDRYPYVLWRESWGGGEMLARSWSVYSGSTFALTGDIEAPGWRLRTTGGYGQYTYHKHVRGLDGVEYRKLTGRKAFSDALLGYHWQLQRLNVKAFGGLTSERHIIDPRDTENAAAGFSYGGKVALEAWLSISNRHWVAADMSWTSALNTVKVGAKTGYAIIDDVDVGIEARFEGDETFDAGRAGMFATWRLGDVGLTAAAGMTGDRDMHSSSYVSFNLFYRY